MFYQQYKWSFQQTNASFKSFTIAALFLSYDWTWNWVQINKVKEVDNLSLLCQWAETGPRISAHLFILWIVSQIR